MEILGYVRKCLNKYNEMPVTVKAAMAYMVCNVFQRSLSFITVPLFTRLLTTEQFGQVSVYNSWKGILTVLVTLQVPHGTFAKAMVKYEDRRDEYTSCAQSFCVIMGVIAIGIFSIFKPVMVELFELPYYILVLMVGEIVLTAAVYCWFARERFEYRYKQVVGFTLTQAVLFPVISFIFVINSKERGYARIIGSAVVSIVTGLAIFVVGYFRGRKLFDRDFFKYIIGFNLTLLPYYLSQIVFNSSDRIMIGKIKNEADVGVYGIGYELGMLLSFVLSAVLNVFQPWVFEHIKDGTVRKKGNITTFIAIGMAVLVLCIILVAPEAILVIAGKKYKSAMWVVPPVAISLYLCYCASLYLYLCFYYEKKSYMNVATIIAAIVNVVLNRILIPYTGFVGAAYTTLVSYLLFELISYYFYRKILRQYEYEETIYNDRHIFFVQLIVTVTGLAIMMVYQFPTIRVVVVCIIFIVAVINRRKILDIYYSIRKR